MAKKKSARKTLREYCACEPRFAFILAQWHPTKNNALTPDDVSPSSRAMVWWLCENGHEWQTQVASRRYGSGCPVCLEQLKENKKSMRRKKL